MATFDVIGVYQNGKIVAPPFNSKALVPFQQDIMGFTRGEDLLIRMFCQNNDGSALDITNWSFETSVQLAQPQSPAQAAPTPPINISRNGVIVNPAPPVQSGVPFGGVVEFRFIGLSETAFWKPWPIDSYDIFATPPGGTGQQECFVPSSTLEVQDTTTIFPPNITATPTPPPPFTFLLSYPTAQVPDPRGFPQYAIIRNQDTGQILWNTGGGSASQWLPIPFFIPTVPGQWAGTPPSDIGAAINRLTAAVYALRGNSPIP